MKQKAVKKAEVKNTELASLTSQDFDVVRARETERAERKKLWDAPVIEFQRRMANAPEILQQVLEHFRTIGPSTRTLAASMLAKHTVSSYDTPGVKKAIEHLRAECQGALNQLTTLPPQIELWYERITSGVEDFLSCYTIESKVDAAWAAVHGYESFGKAFTDFPKLVAALEAAIVQKVKSVHQDRIAGIMAPVDRAGGPPDKLTEAVVIKNIVE